MGFATDAIHAGQPHEKVTGAVCTPIFMASTFAQDELGADVPYLYSRVQNPTREALEKSIAVLEGGLHGIAFSSGVAAVHSIMSLLSSGDHVIIAEEVYGGTFRLFEQYMGKYGISSSFVNPDSIENLQAALRPETKLVYIETPSNPLLKLTDIELVADFAKANGIISVADNTFMTPYFQRPLSHGIDLVLHSTSKYLSGHSDIIGGIVVTNSDTLNKKLRFNQKAVGAVPSPFDCWLTLRSIKTLPLRVQKHNDNALAVALFLHKHPKIKNIYHPGLPEHPGKSIAQKQMTGFGGVVSIELYDFETTKLFLKKLKLFSLCESLGGVESMVNHSATMSHSSVPASKRNASGITESLVRLSVGIEDIEDILSDLKQALED